MKTAETLCKKTSNSSFSSYLKQTDQKAQFLTKKKRVECTI